MIEYQVLTEPPATIQKLLNQWRHQYTITIYGCHMEPLSGRMTVLLSRQRQPQEKQVRIPGSRSELFRSVNEKRRQKKATSDAQDASGAYFAPDEDDIPF